MKKRLLNLLLVIVMVACVLPFAASAAESDCTNPWGHIWNNGNCIYCPATESGSTTPPDAVTCEHDFSIELETVLAPTCTKRGIIRYQCSKCEETKKINVKALGHKPVEMPETEPTCTMSIRRGGEKCEVCDVVLKEPEVVAGTYLGHSYKSKVTKKATCIEKGEKTISCKNCDYSDTEEIPATGHSVTNDPATMIGEAVVAPTCSAEGKGKFACTNANCDYWDYGVIPCVECKPREQEEKPATCTETGRTAGSKCEYCGKVMSGREVIPALDHDFSVEFKVVTAPTCTEEGSSVFKCSRCDSYKELPVAKVPHVEKVVPAVAPTCKEAGKTEGLRCANCTEIFVYCESVPATGHDFSIQHSIVKEPTCQVEGIVKMQCANCKTFRDEPLAKVACVPEDLAEIPADCVNSGKTAGTRCKFDGCKKILSGREVIPALDHDFSVEFKVVTAPTCTAEGSSVFKCSRCDNYKELPVAKAPHVEKVVPAVAPTCKEAGKTEGLRCANCTEIFVYCEPVPATGHDFSIQHSIVKEPTCREEGIVKMQCANCKTYRNEPLAKVACVPEEVAEIPADCINSGKTAGTRCKFEDCRKMLSGREVIPALGHELVLSDFVSTQPTCTEKGWGRYICTREGCDHSEGGWVDALGHDYEVLVKNDATCTNDGYEGSECKTCHHQVITKLEKTGHTEEVLPAVPATCTAAGLTEGKKCATCGEVMEAQKEVAMLEHAWADEAGVPETCKEDGYTAYKKCTACGAEEGKTVIEAAHKYDGTKKCTVCGAGDPLCKHENAIHKHTDSTCTDPGRDSFWCPDCNYEHMGEDLPLAAHTVEVQTTPATCTAKGQTVEFCTVCNQVVKSIELPMTEHNFVRGKCACGATEATRPGTTGRPENNDRPGTTGRPESGCQHADTSTYIEPATCFISGYKVVTCKTCNTVVERETLKATGHTEKTDVYPATCTQNGAKIVTCSVCNELIRHETLKATGHSYSNGMCSDCGAADPNRYTYDFQDVHVVGGTSY